MLSHYSSLPRIFITLCWVLETFFWHILQISASVMQRMRVGPSSSATSKQEAQDDIDDQRLQARTMVLVTFAAFGAIVLALRVGMCVLIYICMAIIIPSHPLAPRATLGAQWGERGGGGKCQIPPIITIFSFMVRLACCCIPKATSILHVCVYPTPSKIVKFSIPSTPSYFCYCCLFHVQEARGPWSWDVTPCSE